jgi:hypothetical protein
MSKWVTRMPQNAAPGDDGCLVDRNHGNRHRRALLRLTRRYGISCLNFGIIGNVGTRRHNTIMTNLTQRIAAVLGPTLVAVTVSEAINLKIWKDVHPTLVFLNGLILFAAGMFIVTSHNRWRPGRAFLVTLSGWLLVLAGAYRMFFPAAPQLAPNPSTYALIALVGLLGVALSVIAFLDR